MLGKYLTSLNELFTCCDVRDPVMKKNLLSLVSVFIALISLAQPPQSNGVSNGIKFNNFVETTVVLDSVQLQLMEKDEIPVADDVKQLNESEGRQQNNFKKEADVYKARKVALKSNSTSRSASDSEEVQLQHSVTKLKGLAQTQSEQIEANILYYDQGNFNADRATELNEALRLNPNHPEGLRLRVANSLVIGDTLTVLTTLNRIESLGLTPQAIRCYASDLINSVPNQTTLITHGTLDTYYAFYEQQLAQKKAITIISLDLLQSQQYRALLLKKGYSIPVQPTVDVTYLGDFIRINPATKFAFSMTIPREYLFQFEQDIVPNGLVFLYPNSLNEAQVLLNNEQFMDSFSYLDCGEALDETVSALKQNYLPMILTVETLSTDKSKEKRSKIENKKYKIRPKK
mgnify:FL=1